MADMVTWGHNILSVLEHYNDTVFSHLLMLCLTFIFGDTIDPFGVETLE